MRKLLSHNLLVREKECHRGHFSSFEDQIDDRRDFIMEIDGICRSRIRTNYGMKLGIILNYFGAGSGKSINIQRNNVKNRKTTKEETFPRRTEKTQRKLVSESLGFHFFSLPTVYGLSKPPHLTHFGEALEFDWLQSPTHEQVKYANLKNVINHSWKLSFTGASSDGIKKQALSLGKLRGGTCSRNGNHTKYSSIYRLLVRETQ